MRRHCTLNSFDAQASDERAERERQLQQKTEMVLAAAQWRCTLALSLTAQEAEAAEQQEAQAPYVSAHQISRSECMRNCYACCLQCMYIAVLISRHPQLFFPVTCGVHPVGDRLVRALQRAAQLPVVVLVRARRHSWPPRH